MYYMSNVLKTIMCKVEVVIKKKQCSHSLLGRGGDEALTFHKLLGSVIHQPLRHSYPLTHSWECILRKQSIKMENNKDAIACFIIVNN